MTTTQAGGKPSVPMKETERVVAGPGPGRGPFGGGMVGQKSMSFGPSARRLVRRMRPDRGQAVAVLRSPSSASRSASSGRRSSVTPPT